MTPFLDLKDIKANKCKISKKEPTDATNNKN